MYFTFTLPQQKGILARMNTDYYECDDYIDINYVFWIGQFVGSM